MATSLARQLEQLRANSVETQGQRSNIAQQGPNILNVILSGEQLTLLSKDAFSDLSQVCPSIEQFKNQIFGDDQDDFGGDDSDVDMETGDEKSSSIKDFLFLLSPHLLSKPAQYLLQYLITKQKIHKKFGEILLFISLPYHQFAIFNKIIEALPVRKTTSEHEDHPRWVEHFRLACHPATTVGLHRHIACDRGFFNLLCTLMVRLMKEHLPKFGNNLGVNYNHLIHFFASSMVSSLNLCNAVSEHQTLDLMRIIFAGLKVKVVIGSSESNNAVEFRALASILFAYLVPRVELKSKVCVKLLKILEKVCKKHQLTQDTLTLIAILYRCQRSNILEEKSQLLKLFLDHEEMILDIVDNADRKEEEEKNFAKRLQKAIALLLDDVSESATIPELSKFLKVNYQALGQSHPSSETAEVLIASVSKIVVRLNSKWKKIKKAKAKKSECDEDETSVKEGLILSNKILESLRKNFVEEFSNKSKLNKGKDIFVMDNLDELPTTEQIVVKRILLNNSFVKELMEDSELKPFFDRSGSTNILKESIKTNGSAVKAIFATNNHGFIIRQIPPRNLVVFVVRLLKVYSHKFTIFKKILDFVSSREFQEDSKLRKEIEELGVDFVALVFPMLFSKYDKVAEISLSFVKNIFQPSPLKDVVKDLETVADPNASLEHAKDSFDLNCLNSVIGSSIKCRALMEPAHVTLFGIFAAAVLNKFSKNKKIEKSILENVLGFLMLAVDTCRIAGANVKTEIDDENDQPSDEEGPKSDFDLYCSALKTKSISYQLLEIVLEAVSNQLPKLELDPKSELEICLQGFFIGSKLKSLHLEADSKKAFNTFGENLSAQLLAKVAATQTAAGVKTLRGSCQDLLDEVRIFCCKRISTGIKREQLSTVLPFLLTALTSANKKVRKLMLKTFEHVLGQETKKTMKSVNYMPLLKHLLDHKSEISSNLLNLFEIMSEFGENDSNENILDNLLAIVMDCNNSNVFVQLCPLVASLKSSISIQKVSRFGVALLKDESVDAGDSLAALISTFMPAIMDHSEDYICFEFICQSVSAHKQKLVHNNIQKSVAVLALEFMYSPSKKLTETRIVEKLFNLMIDLSGTSESSDVFMQGRKIVGVLNGVSTKMVLAKLGSIWGEKIVKEDQGQSGRFSVRAAAQVDLDKNWRMTLFLLEVGLPRLSEDSPSLLHGLLKPLGILIKEALDQSEQYDNSYQLDLLLSSILEIMDKIGAKSLNEKSINPELMVRCIRTCQNPNTKATALLILAKSSAANPEYILHNSIPIFTFMGTHFLKIDAKHSFDVACQAIDVIIPHIQGVCLAKNSANGPKKMAETSLTILHTFADASVDMPHPHRVRTFMYKLLSRLGELEYMWILTILLLRKIDTAKPKKSFVAQSTEDKLEQLRELFSMFDIGTQLHAVLKILTNLKDDAEALRIVFGVKSVPEPGSQQNLELMKSLLTLRVQTMAFVNYLLTSRHFMEQVSKRLQEVEESESERNLIYQQLEQLLEANIVNTDYFDKLVKSGNTRKQFVACCEKILEAILSLLPLKVFVKLLSTMLINQKTSVRKKMLEVFNAQLQQANEGFIEEEDLPDLLDPLVQLATSDAVESNPLNQQLALLCLRSFGRVAASTSPKPFNEVCKKLSDKKFLESLDNQAVKAATILCLTELFQSLGPHSVVFLRPYVTWILDLMTEPTLVTDNMVVLNSIILSVQKCLDNFGGFLNPYFKSFVVSTCKLMKINGDEFEEDKKSQATKSRLRHLCAAISRSIPTPKLVDIATECYDELLSEPVHCIVAFSIILRDNLTQQTKFRALAISATCLRLFQHLFKYRQTESDINKVELVESNFIETFLALMLKLSLDDFKPIFYRLFNLSLGGGENDDVDSLTTMFHITKAVAKKLKSLFAFICETLVQKTTLIFNKYSKDEFAIVEKADHNAQSKIAKLFCHMLDAMTVVFAHNQIESLLIKNYEDHVNAILTLVEAPLKNENKESLLLKVRECLGQMAVSTEDETQWKYLNYQVLLYIRNNELEVRLFVLDVVDVFLDNKGENYLTVLPDSVPLLAEALEDDNSKVEARCRKLITKMESIFGHSVENYFE